MREFGCFAVPSKCKDAMPRNTSIPYVIVHVIEACIFIIDGIGSCDIDQTTVSFTQRDSGAGSE